MSNILLPIYSDNWSDNFAHWLYIYIYDLRRASLIFVFLANVIKLSLQSQVQLIAKHIVRAPSAGSF